MNTLAFLISIFHRNLSRLSDAKEYSNSIPYFNYHFFLNTVHFKFCSSHIINKLIPSILNVLILSFILFHKGEQFFEQLCPFWFQLPCIHQLSPSFQEMHHQLLFWIVFRRIPMIGLNKSLHLIESYQPSFVLCHITSTTANTNTHKTPKRLSKTPSHLVPIHFFAFQHTDNALAGFAIAVGVNGFAHFFVGGGILKQSGNL